LPPGGIGIRQFLATVIVESCRQSPLNYVYVQQIRWRLLFDICLIGHVSWDTVVWQGRAGEMGPGGSAYHAARTLGCLGASTALITAVARADADALLAPLHEAGVTVFNLPSDRTMHTRNEYLGSPTDGERRQWLVRAADPIDIADSFLPEAGAYHLCGLLAGDIADTTSERLRDCEGSIAITLGSFLYRVSTSDGALLAERPASGTARLTGYDFVQASARDILTMTEIQETMQAAAKISTQGVGEVVVTNFAPGAFVLAEGRGLSIPIAAPSGDQGPAGLDDAFFAAYLWRRLRAETPSQAADYAGIVASLLGSQSETRTVEDAMVNDLRQQGSDLFYDRR
jgi:sugar/nucleoside kinase (ribokinase family)